MEYGSRQVKWYWLLLFIGFCAFAVHRLFQGNPYLYSHSELRTILTQSADRPRQTIPAHPVALGRLTPQTFISRYNLERTAVDPLGLPRSRAFVEAAHHVIDFGKSGFEPTNIVGDRTGFYLSGKTTWVMAVDLEGVVRWRYKFSERAGDHPVPTILLDSERVYLIHPAGEVVSLEKTTGKLRWVMDLHQDVVAPPFFWSRSVMVPVKSADARGVDKVQLVQVHRSDGVLEAPHPKLDVKPGIQFSFSPVLEAFVGTVDNKVIAIDPEDWDILWTQTLTDPIRGPAVLVDQQIYVSTLAGKIVRLDGGRKGKIDWEADLPKAPLSPPTYLPLVQRLSVLDQTGGLNVIETKTGKPQWRESTENKNPLVETWSARLKGRNIEEFKMDWIHKGWAIWSPCSDKRLCIYAPKQGQLIQKIVLSGQPMALPLLIDRGYAVMTQLKGGQYGVARLIEETEIKKAKE